MSKQNMIMATLIFVGGVLASLLSVAAQDGQRAPKPPQDVLIERDVIITAPRSFGGPSASNAAGGGDGNARRRI
ncbi:MAG: hypothetical protein WKF84_11915 [Pyrinomonadaceae bacterium]